MSIPVSYTHLDVYKRQGEYSLLMGKAKTIPGPFNQGTYIWIEVDDLKKLEDKLVCGPYVHHCTGIYEDILPQVFEAVSYTHLDVYKRQILGLLCIRKRLREKYLDYALILTIALCIVIFIEPRY